MTSTVANLETALRLTAAGFSVFPCHSGGDQAKRPMPSIFWRSQSSNDQGQIRRWWQKWPEAAIGLDLAKSGLLVVDADRHGAHDGVQAFGDLIDAHGFNPDDAPLVATPGQGNHHYFRQPEGMQLGNSPGALPAGIDVRGAGGYVIAPGTVMQDGRTYEIFGTLADAPVAPAWLVEILTARRAEPKRSPSAVPTLPPPATSEIDELLAVINPDVGYQDWLSVLMAVHAATGGAGFAMADAWSARGSKYPGTRELQKKWASFRRTGISSRTLAQIAGQHGADLSAIAIKYNLPAFDAEEADTAARRLIEHHDGTLADAATGEIIGVAASSATKPPATTFPPGLVGEIAQWILATSRRPQPELAIGAALAIVGTVAGRQFAGPTRSGTHLYILGLAPTGKGKDHPLQQISRIMTAAKLSMHIGPSEFISMPAVVNFLTRKPLSLCPMDEFGGFMKRINSRRASGFESSISKVLRTMWSSSFAPYLTPEWAQKPSEAIQSPCMSIFGASTPEQFYSAMEGSSLEDGTLNRFLVLAGHARVEECEPALKATEVPASIVDRLRRIYLRSGELSSGFRNDPAADPAAAGLLRILPWRADGAHDAYKAFSKGIERRMDKDAGVSAFFARTVEMALRIATIIAIGRLDDEQVRKTDFEYGMAVAYRSANTMAVGAADYMAENDNQANAQKIVRALKVRGGRASQRDLMRSLQNSIRARDLKEILGAMCDSGQLERQEVKHPTGPPTFHYAFSS